jgi:hypothetical protein
MVEILYFLQLLLLAAAVVVVVILGQVDPVVRAAAEAV